MNLTQFIFPLGILLSCSLILMIPFILNGFPLVFSDSNLYIWPVWDWAAHPPFYGFAVGVLRLFLSERALLVIPAIQSFFVSLLLYLSFKSLSPYAPRWLLFSGMILVIGLSQLPWLTSWIMTDVWLGIGVLSILVLGTDYPRGSTGRLLLWILLVFCSVIATSNVVIFLSSFLLFILARYFLDGVISRRFVLSGMAAVSVAVLITLISNMHNFGVARLNVASGAILFSRTIDLKLAQPYLAGDCSLFDVKFCSDVLALPKKRQSFLWMSDLPYRSNAWIDPDGRFSRAAHLVIWRNLLTFIKRGLHDATWVILNPTLGTGDLNSKTSIEPLYSRIAEFYPSQLAAFRSAKQQSDQILPLFPKTFYMSVTFASYTAALGALMISFLWRDNIFSAVGVLIFQR